MYSSLKNLFGNTDIWYMEQKDIDAAIEHLMIRTNGEILSRIEQLSDNVSIEDTATTVHCHMLKIDANGHTRLDDLVEFIDSKLVEYAIPKKEIDEARKDFNTTGSPHKILALKRKAESLFTDLNNTGEGGEILLYILTQEFLGYPQLLSKMSLKTSGQLHYQGADGIHVGYDKEQRNLHLYWGESKMYKTINDAVSACVLSIKDYLLNPQVQERDLQLITSNISSNVNDPVFEDLLVHYFDKDSDFSNHVIYKGICFIGFDNNTYPSKDDLSKTTVSIKEQLEQELESWYALLKNNIKKHLNLDKKEIHFFLMPFPSVEEFREKFLKTIHREC